MTMGKLSSLKELPPGKQFCSSFIANAKDVDNRELGVPSSSEYTFSTQEKGREKVLLVQLHILHNEYLDWALEAFIG